MMTSPDKSLLTYDKLMDELRRCCTEKKTCVAMISTKGNRLARIMFEKGNIIFLAYGSTEVFRLNKSRNSLRRFKEELQP